MNRLKDIWKDRKIERGERQRKEREKECHNLNRFKSWHKIFCYFLRVVCLTVLANDCLVVVALAIQRQNYQAKLALEVAEEVYDRETDPEVKRQRIEHLRSDLGEDAV